MGVPRPTTLLTVRDIVAFLLLGAGLALLGATWIDLTLEQRIAAVGTMFGGVLLLIGRRGR